MSKTAPNWLSNLEKYMPGPGSKYKDQVAGFWIGVLHGIILPLTFIYQFYNSDVELYRKENKDPWYNFAFILGIVFLLRAFSDVD